jgi:hypothetical protein
MADDHIPHAHFLEGSFHYLALKNEILNGAKKKDFRPAFLLMEVSD